MMEEELVEGSEVWCHFGNYSLAWFYTVLHLMTEIISQFCARRTVLLLGGGLTWHTRHKFNANV